MKEQVYISTDKKKLNVDFIHSYLSNESYWAKGRSVADVTLSIDNSLCFGLYLSNNDVQIGFGRVATDFVVFAWLMDVFIDTNFRGRGYGKMLVDEIINHPKLEKVKGIGLRTNDAHRLYSIFGFGEIPDSKTWMFKTTKK